MTLYVSFDNYKYYSSKIMGKYPEGLRKTLDTILNLTVFCPKGLGEPYGQQQQSYEPWG